MAKYRESWNPPTHGSSFTTSADLSRQGQWYVRLYVQGQIGSGEFENNVPSKGSALPVSPDAVAPAAMLYYGLTRNVRWGPGVSWIYWPSDNTDARCRKCGSRIGTTSVDFKYSTS